MTRCRRTLLLAGATAALTGCADLRTWVKGSNAGPPPATQTAARPAPGTPQPQELPDKESAKLQLAMAQQSEQLGTSKGDADAALYYEAVRANDPKFADLAQRKLAVLYDKLDQQSKALAEYQQLLARYPKDPSLLNDVGYSYYNRGQWADAERYLRQAVDRDPGHRLAWNNLGMAHAQQGKLKESYEAFTKAGGTPADAYANIGFLLATQGKRTEAAGCYREALKLDPVHPKAQDGLARLEKAPSPDGAVAPAGAGQEARGNVMP